jgi:MFS family permease
VRKADPAEFDERERPLLAAHILWALQFLGGLASAPVYALLPIYVERVLTGSPFYTASLKSYQLALGGLSAPLTGALADRLGYKSAYLWGMTSTVAACAVFLTGQPALLCTLFLYSGLVGSLQTTSGQAYLMGASDRGRLGIASAGYFLGYTLGTALGSAAAGRFIQRGFGGPLALAFDGHDVSHRGYFLLGLVTTLLAAALIVAGMQLLPALRRPPGAGKPGFGLTDAFRTLRRRDVRLLVAIRFLPTCYWGAVTLLVPLLLSRLTGSAESAGNYAGLSLAIAAGCQIVTGRLCDQIGVELPVRLAPIGITISAVGLAVGARSAGALWLFGILGSCSAWSLSTTMPLLIDRVSSPTEKGRIVGLTALAWSAGMLAGTLAAGSLASGWLGARLPGLPFALAALCGLGTVGLAVAMTRRAPLEASVTVTDAGERVTGEPPGADRSTLAEEDA